MQVELLNVPLLLHVAWHQHAETLLRELLLVRLGADPDDDAGLDDLVAHATASEAIALLFAQLPDPGLGDDADELMVTASEPAVSSAREVLSVPPDVVGCFDVLEQALDAANALAEAGALLAPPTQPEVRSFRRWVCAEVQAQGDGGAATPWTEPEVPAGRWRPETGWEVDAVLRSPQSLIAADDTNRIIAVSETALALLGYDRADGAGRPPARRHHPGALPPGAPGRFQPLPLERARPAGRPAGGGAGAAPRRHRGPARDHDRLRAARGRPARLRGRHRAGPGRSPLGCRG